MANTEFSDALPLGTVVAGYRLTGVIAQTGLSIIYEAVSAVDAVAKRVIIKELFVPGMCTRAGGQPLHAPHDGTDAGAAVRARFETEARKIIMDYHHESIVKGENVLNEHASTFLIMEHVDGSTLKDWLARLPAPATEMQIRAVLSPILDAIEYMHQRGDLHRDISPENILVTSQPDEDLRSMLIDFMAVDEGFSRAPNAPAMALVRPGYSPPEQYDPARLGQRRHSDVYAFGAVLYFCITSHVPVPATERMAAVQAGGPGADPYVRAVDLAGRNRFSPLLLSAIDQALRLEGNERPQTVDGLRSALGWITSRSGRLRFVPTAAAGWPSDGPSDARSHTDEDFFRRNMAFPVEGAHRYKLRFGWDCSREGAAETLAAVARHDPDFDLIRFLEAAAATYLAIGEALALDDLARVKDLLAPHVYDDLAARHTKHEAHGRSTRARVVRPTGVIVWDVDLVGRTALFHLLITGNDTATTRGDAGTLVYATDETVMSVSRLLTFARAFDQEDCPWMVVASESIRLGLP